MTKKNTASQMRKLVKAYQESGQSQREFASAQGLKEGKLNYWISKFTKPQQSVSNSAKKNFVPIAVTPMATSEVRSIVIRSASGVEIEIPL